MKNLLKQKFYLFYQDFDKDLLFVISLMSLICFRINFILKLDINLFFIFIMIILLSSLIYYKIKFFSFFIKNNKIFNLIFYYFLLAQNSFYEMLYFQNYNFTFTEKIIIFFGLFNFGAISTYILLNYQKYVFFNIIIFLIILLYKILSMVEKYIINNFFQKNEIISYHSIQKKIKVKNLMFLKENKQLNFIHKRHFIMPFDQVLKDLIRNRILVAAGSLSLGTVSHYAYESYQHQEDRKISSEANKIAKDRLEFDQKIQLNNFYQNCFENKKKNIEEIEIQIARTKDNVSILNNKKHEIFTLEELKKTYKEDLEKIKKDASILDIKIYPPVFESFNWFF